MLTAQGDATMTNYFRKDHKGGFTLIETSIVVAIISLMIVGALGLYKVMIQKEHMDTTKERLADIGAALARYKNSNGYLPCPAPLTAAPLSATFGKSDTTNCAAAAVQAGTTRFTNPVSGGTVRIGAVPVVTLGLSVEDSVDRWGRRFVYAVSEQLADGVPYDENNGAITLLGNGDVVLGPRQDKTPFVVFSAGPTGAGAYTYDGKPFAVACPAGGPEKENCDNANATFRAMSFSSSRNSADRFDDIIISSFISLGDHAAFCGNLGMIYGPQHPQADANGCVPKVVQSATGSVGVGGAPTSAAPLDVAGEVTIGNTTLGCSPAMAGAMRYNAGGLTFCNGTVWRNLGGDQGDKGPTGPAGNNTIMAAVTCAVPASLGGGTIAVGASVTAYLTSSTTCGAPCQSQVRVCQANGTLSGTYTRLSCTVGGADHASNGVCDCGETTASHPAECPPPAPIVFCKAKNLMPMGSTNIIQGTSTLFKEGYFLCKPCEGKLDTCRSDGKWESSNDIMPAAPYQHASCYDARGTWRCP